MKHVNMGMERWGFLLSVVSSPIVYFLKTTQAVCPNINPIMFCTHICDVNYAACYIPRGGNGAGIMVSGRIHWKVSLIHYSLVISQGLLTSRISSNGNP